MALCTQIINTEIKWRTSQSSPFKYALGALLCLMYIWLINKGFPAIARWMLDPCWQMDVLYNMDMEHRPPPKEPTAPLLQRALMSAQLCDWWPQTFVFLTTMGSEICKCPDLLWSKRGRFTSCPDLEWDSKSGSPTIWKATQIYFIYHFKSGLFCLDFEWSGFQIF